MGDNDRETWEQYLEKVYQDPSRPGSFSGPEKLYRAVRDEGKYVIGRTRIKKWLQSQDEYTTNRSIRRKFPVNRVVVQGIDAIFDTDLMDFQRLSSRNDGFRYVLLMIDIFSRFVWARPLKSKSGKDVGKQIDDIFKQGRTPVSIRSDGGQELDNKDVNAVWKKWGVKHYITHNQPQANYAERSIKTIKSKLYKYMKRNKTWKYIDVLQNVVKGYNNTKHRSLGMAPAEISTRNEMDSRVMQYVIRQKGLRKKTTKKITAKKKPFKLKLGDTVRIPFTKGKFDREYDERFSPEVYKITNRYRRQGINVYSLEDLGKEKIQGTFYQDELQKVNYDPDGEFRIEKVLRSRQRKGQPKEVLIKWLQWPRKFSSWIAESQIKVYK